MTHHGVRKYVKLGAEFPMGSMKDKQNQGKQGCSTEEKKKKT